MPYRQQYPFELNLRISGLQCYLIFSSVSVAEIRKSLFKILNFQNLKQGYHIQFFSNKAFGGTVVINRGSIEIRLQSLY